MALSITELIKGQFGAVVTSQFAGEFHELEAGVKKAIHALIPIVMVHFSGMDTHPAFIQKLEQADDEYFLRNGTISASKKEEIEYWVNTIFGKKTGDITNVVATYSGVNNSSAHHLMKMIISVAMGILGKKIQDENLNLESIQHFIKALEGEARASFPESFPLERLEMEESSTAALKGLPDMPQDAKRKDKWISIAQWWIPLVLLICAGYFSFKTIKEVHDFEENSEKIDTLSLKKIRDGLIDIPMKDTLISGRAEGFEELMIGFLSGKDSLDTVKEKVFIMERVKYERMGEKVLTSSSLEQIKNLAMILKYHPEVMVEISVYNNDIDNAQKNTALSEKRASYIYEILRRYDNRNQIIAVKGLGNSNATVPLHPTEEERNKDRKVEVKVIKP